MNLARSLWRLGTPLDGPCPALVRTGREEGDQAQKRVARGNESVQTALPQAQLGQEGVFFLRLHLSDFFLYLRADGKDLRSLSLCNLPNSLDVGRIWLTDFAVRDVGGVDDRFVGEQEPAGYDLALLIGHGKGARGLAGFQMSLQPLAYICFQCPQLVPVLQQMARLLRAPFHGLQVRQNQLQIDDLNITPGINAAIDVDDVFVLKAAHHVNDGIHFANMRKEFVAQPLAAAGTLHQACNVHKFHRRRRDLLGLIHPRQLVKPLVRHGYHAGVGLDGAERIVGRLRTRACNGVEQRALAYVWESHNAQLHLVHFLSICVFQQVV